MVKPSIHLKRWVRLFSIPARCNPQIAWTSWKPRSHFGRRKGRTERTNVTYLESQGSGWRSQSASRLGCRPLERGDESRRELPSTWARCWAGRTTAAWVRRRPWLPTAPRNLGNANVTEFGVKTGIWCRDMKILLVMDKSWLPLSDKIS